MEPTVLSGPLGHSQWESDQPFPVGFHTLNSDSGGVFGQNKSDQTGFNFRNGNQHQTSQDKNVFQDKLMELDNLINISDLSCGDLNCEEDSHALHTFHIEELSYTEKTDESDENRDCTLSWLFSSNLTDVFGDNSAYKELTMAQEAPVVSDNTFSTDAELISFSVPDSPSKISQGNFEINTGHPFLMVDLLSNEPCNLPPESSGELNPQGGSEDLVDISKETLADLPLSQNRETLSPETGDKGLLSDQVTELRVTCSTTLKGLAENCLPQNHISTPLECFEGSVPLLDLEVPSCDSSLSLCPASPVSDICTGAPLNLVKEESEEEHAGAIVIRNLTSEQPSDNDLVGLDLSDESASLTVALVEDAFIQGELTSDGSSVEKVSKDLMEDNFCSEAKKYRNEAMALDLCLTADEVHDGKPWDLKPQEDVPNGSVHNPPIEREEERLTDINELEGSDCHEVASFDFSLQDLNTSSPEAVWTSEQTVSCSKMVVDDSLPLVSAVNTDEEEVSPLKAVFDALDQDGDGFVRIEEFMEFAAAYGADQVRCLVLLLTYVFFIRSIGYCTRSEVLCKTI